MRASCCKAQKVYDPICLILTPYTKPSAFNFKPGKTYTQSSSHPRSLFNPSGPGIALYSPIWATVKSTWIIKGHGSL